MYLKVQLTHKSTQDVYNECQEAKKKKEKKKKKKKGNKKLLPPSIRI